MSERISRIMARRRSLVWLGIIALALVCIGILVTRTEIRPAEVVMDDNLLKQLRTGQTATFIIFQTPEEGIGFPMSLKGFGEGYDKLP